MNNIMVDLPNWALWVIIGLAIMLLLCIWHILETIWYYCTCTPCRKCLCCCKKTYEKL